MISGLSRAAALAVAVLGLSACLDAPAGDADLGDVAYEISGGDAVTSGPVAASTVMMVAQGNDGSHGCSASILDASHALTAAHCTIGLGPDNPAELVFAPVVRGVPGAPRRLVTQFAIPTSFLEDIAVLTFIGGLPAGYAPVAVAKAGFVLTANVTPVVMAGYGQTTAAVNDRGTLHQGTSTYRQQVATKRYLATGATSGVCSGDSGGPDYVIRNGTLVQIGVHVSGDCATSTASTDVRQFNVFLTSSGAQPMFVR
jgi:secreted trypsin-like serine protease